ncbi:MAG: CRISPR system precrRNA processing endoribonuclease RAMP protein Cas6 [Deltaproteobacteria bacterium]|nr:CRISPR system precrRNA processing endoribonuclease RAMP protein Cas6 [Deltaproteobacteria bacterium]
MGRPQRAAVDIYRHPGTVVHSETLSELSAFRFARFRFHLRAQECLRLPPYKGSALRGGFGQVFRRIACLGSELGFGQCLLGERCPYHYIFETPPPAGSVILGKIPTAPQPFVLEPPLETKQIYERGEALVFHLVLIGTAFDYLPYFLYTFDELGRVGLGQGKGKYELESVAWLDEAGNAVLIYDGSRKMLTDSFHALSLSQLSVPPSAPFQLSVSFLTPTRLKYENQLAANCEFHVFFRNLVRRIALLNYFHCGGEFPPERKDFVEQARSIEMVSSELHWVDRERYSNRQQRWTPIGGFVGHVTYRGDLAPFLPYLRLGEYTHVGKGATFGLGGYKMTLPVGQGRNS